MEPNPDCLQAQIEQTLNKVHDLCERVENFHARLFGDVRTEPTAAVLKANMQVNALLPSLRELLSEASSRLGHTIDKINNLQGAI